MKPFDLSSKSDRYRARKAGIDIPLLRPGMRQVDPLTRVHFGYGCWFWLGDVNRDGYGRFTKDGKGVLAHRWFYEECVGPLKPRSVLMHSCDNPACVNPAHLSVGTHSTNRRDTVSKNRQAKGERMALAKLTDDAVRDIRHRHAAGVNSQKHLAKEYQVDKALISRIIKRKSWRHVA